MSELTDKQKKKREYNERYKNKCKKYVQFLENEVENTSINQDITNENITIDNKNISKERENNTLEDEEFKKYLKDLVKEIYEEKKNKKTIKTEHATIEQPQSDMITRITENTMTQIISSMGIMAIPLIMSYFNQPQQQQTQPQQQQQMNQQQSINGQSANLLHRLQT